MDTNLVTPAIVTKAVMIDWNTIILATIAFLGTAFTSIVGLFVMVINNRTKKTAKLVKETNDSAKESQVSAKATSEEVVKVAHSVNSERTATLAKVEALSNKILEMAKEMATMREKERGQAEEAVKVIAGKEAVQESLKVALTALRQAEPAAPGITGVIPMPIPAKEKEETK